MTRKRKEVVIIQGSLTFYRIPFYERLRTLLADRDVDLKVFYSEPIGKHETTNGPLGRWRPRTPSLWKEFSAELLWGTKYKRVLLPGGLVWTTVWKDILKSDLVIVEHASKHITNYILFFLRHLGGPKLAFWGHGWDHQAENDRSFSEQIKEWTGKRADWYFSYTWKVREALISRGYDSDRVTDVQNAVASPVKSACINEIEGFRRLFHLNGTCKVGLFCGRMYPLKRLNVMVDVARKVQESLPSFHMIFAGAGPDQHIAEEAAEQFEYMHYTGPLLGEAKEAIFSLADTIIFPGAVGLGIVDAFHYRVPPIIAQLDSHGPEFAYLEDGMNGLLVDADVDELSSGIMRVLSDENFHAHLVEGCKDSSKRITIDEMAFRFANGISAALGSMNNNGL